MIRLLKALADWLDKRYPPRFRYTEKHHKEIWDRISYSEDVIKDRSKAIGHLDGRIKVLEESIAAIKDLLAKNGANILKPEAQKLRDEFIAFPERFNMTGTNATK